MKRVIIWQSEYYRSTETCQVEIPDEIVINSVITGRHDNTIYTAEYVIKISSEWKVKQFEIAYSLNGIKNLVTGIHHPKGWIINKQERPEFKNCVDIDITVTPFTNSLPINRLKLPVNVPRQIDVLYIDVLENRIYPVKQQYTKKSNTEYNFQNVPNDFEADIGVDKEGFVAHYPGLFERIA